MKKLENATWLLLTAANVLLLYLVCMHTPGEDLTEVVAANDYLQGLLVVIVATNVVGYAIGLGFRSRVR